MTKAIALLATFLAAPLLAAQRAPSGTIVASNMDAHSASIVDVASGRTITTIQTGEGPHEVAISPNGRRAVVAIYGNRNAVGSSLMVIDLTAPTAPPKIVELGAGNQRPHGLAFLADNASLLVTGERAQRVLVVNVDNGMIDSSMSTKQPTTHMVSLSRDYTRAFTTNIVGMSVSAIDVPSRTVRATFQVGARIEGISVTPDGREVWVGGNESHLVYVLNGTTGDVMHKLEGFGMAYRVGITPDGRTAVISDPGSEKIHIADVATHTVRTVIDVAPMSASDGAAPVPSSPQGVAMSRDNATAYVTLKAVAKVAVVDLKRGAIVKYLPVGAGSDGVGYSPIVVK
ncbi:YncE family protein [Gemmatimonas groenlandica]|uniref:YNCE-like beta-propeller domain-containing protein n=1 Tax=Gemmatimonas groenlandica TaxID=2732249 RepID=A0A6M4IX81_9BACT|nr:hypothetical protein [Gemmatimonas groenlandica]QJR36791.1 hypothetical protein HKW67_15335 [Gemmatimonas groenlandica]